MIAAAAVLVVAGLLTVPTVRAAAAEFLLLFRVSTFVAVPVDPSRLDAMRTSNLDIDGLLGQQVRVLEDPGPPVAAASVDEASARVGFDIRQPEWLPDNTEILEVQTTGPRAVEITADTAQLSQVMDALGITDLAVPQNLDGQVSTLRVPPVVMIRYEHNARFRTRLMQTTTPEIHLPAGVDLSTLGEIGLRVLGLPADEASRFARAIDWETTMIVPIPPIARSFKEVTVNGHQGVVIGFQRDEESPTTMVIWSTGDRLFGLLSIAGEFNALSMANSVR
jgi:hypothetical protein